MTSGHPASATREILAQEPEAALLSPEISNRFFRIYYNNRKNQTNLWDSKNIREMALLNPVSEKVFKSLRFKDINKSFKMIPDASHSVMITIDPEACHIRERLKILDSQGLYPTKACGVKFSVIVYKYMIENGLPYRNMEWSHTLTAPLIFCIPPRQFTMNINEFIPCNKAIRRI